MSDTYHIPLLKTKQHGVSNHGGSRHNKTMKKKIAVKP